MYFCNSVKNNYLGIKIAFKSNEKKKKERDMCARSSAQFQLLKLHSLWLTGTLVQPLPG